MFRLLETQERTKPVCVFWNHSISMGRSGSWSSKGCELVFRNTTHISCQCNHMTSFAVLMDISKREHGDVLPLKVVTYTTVSASLVALLVTFLLLAILRKLRSNLHSIHKNLVAAIFLFELIFLAGINQTDSPFVCTVVAILLHYSYMCTFAWMFVEGLHIYRMLTEMRNVNHGQMRFYYAIGWGFPAIITGLAVGLDPQGYGNPDFCWLSVHDTLIWSITGPIAFVVLINIVIFGLAVKASCGQRRQSETSGAISALRMAILLLLLISATWLLCLMAVNSDVLTFHYLFAILSCLQGIFIFFFHCILNKDVRTNLKTVFGVKKLPTEESITTHTTLLTRSFNGNVYTDDGCLYRTPIGESTVSLENSARSGKSHGSSYIAYTHRGEQKYSSTKSSKKSLCGGDSSLSFKKSKRKGDSDSDSEQSVDEHSSSYASSHSSDSEEEKKRSKPKWNNERSPVHSTPNVDAVVNHVKPCWSVEHPIANEREGTGGSDKLRVQTKATVELQQTNKLSPNGDLSPSDGPPSQPSSTQLPRKGILKNKITYPPPLTDKNLKNRLREKLGDYNSSTISYKSPSIGSNEGLRCGTETDGVIIEASPVPVTNTLATMEPSTSPAFVEDRTDSDASNETSI